MRAVRRNLVRMGGLAAGFAAGMLFYAASRRGPGERDALPGPVVSEAPVPAPPAAPAALPAPERPPADWDAALGAPPRFTDVTAQCGIGFRHFNGSTGKYYYQEIMGGGVGLLDYDGDGFLDIYFVNGNNLETPPSSDIKNRLYRSNGDWTFTDVTDRAGVGDSGYGQGCCVGDYDNDGDPDLYISNYGRNLLYRNNGDGTFTDVAKEAGVDEPGWGQSSAFLDYDNDGWLDLYVQNYLTYRIGMKGEAFIYVGDEKLPDYAAPSNYKGQASRLYRNNRNGTFTDVTEAAGVLRPDGKGMGVACYDMDDDGWVDIFASNDGMDNFLFRNRGDGAFEEIGLISGVAFDGVGVPEASMGVDIGDFDGDGRIDFVVPCTREQTYTLYRNMGQDFADVSARCGLGAATSDRTGFNPNFLDYDNDGDLDLFFTTGGVRAGEFTRAGAAYEQRYGTRDLLLANDGRGAYRDVSAWAGTHFRRQTIGRGSARGDLDNDGDIDLVISNLNGPAVVLRNDTRGGHWVVFACIGRHGTRDALGASLRIEHGGRAQRAVIGSGVTYLSQVDRRVHFGLGNAARIDKLEAVWPGGRRQEFTDIAADRMYVLDETAGGLR